MFFIPEITNPTAPEKGKIKIMNKFYMEKYKLSSGHKYDIAFL
jgi:hypothetical protein